MGANKDSHGIRKYQAYSLLRMSLFMVSLKFYQPEINK
jgi:hypothetical protein